MSTDSKNRINVYFYTAWNGYDWQGCEAGIAADLRRYLEATDTMPKTSGDKPPFGGAIACQIGGKMGVGLYTYLVRPHGDIFGRDSLYVAFAFIPKDFEYKVDFAKLIRDQYMREPLAGEIKRPEEIDCSDYRLEGAEPEELATWWDAVPPQQRLQEPDALTRLSFYFQSEKTQLGLLRAVIKGEKDTAHTVQIDYQVFGEVATVAERAEIYRRKKKENNGILPKSDPTARELQVALNTLRDTRAKKLKEYTGLVNYIRYLEDQMSDREALLKQLETIKAELEKAIGEVQALTLDGSRDSSWHTGVDAMRQKLKTIRSTYIDQKFEKMPILDHHYYWETREKAIQLIKLIERGMAVCDGTDQVAGFLLEERFSRADFFGRMFRSWMDHQLENLREKDKREIQGLTAEIREKDRTIAHWQGDSQIKAGTIRTLQQDVWDKNEVIAKLAEEGKKKDEEIARRKGEIRDWKEKSEKYWSDYKEWKKYAESLEKDLQKITPFSHSYSVEKKPMESQQTQGEVGGEDKPRRSQKIKKAILVILTLGLVCLFMKSCGGKVENNPDRRKPGEKVDNRDNPKASSRRSFLPQSNSSSIISNGSTGVQTPVDLPVSSVRPNTKSTSGIQGNEGVARRQLQGDTAVPGLPLEPEAVQNSIRRNSDPQNQAGKDPSETEKESSQQTNNSGRGGGRNDGK